MKNFNDQPLANVLSEIVYMNKPTIIDSEIVFEEAVFIDKNLQILGNLNTTLLSGFNTSDWLQKAIFIDKGLLSGKLKQLLLSLKIIVYIFITKKILSIVLKKCSHISSLITWNL